ncbi:MAG: methylated-DNA--[protein]-cysteine S-methyltransferase [Alphaproteobacteria bacterium]
MKLRTTTSPPLRVSWGTASSPAGKLVIGLTEKGEICRVGFLRGRKAVEMIAEWQSEWRQTSFKRGAVPQHFSRTPLLLVGTEFQQDVWRVMAKIPSGSVTTYGNIALYIGKPNAARAVGAACGANPVPYFVPCHRVVAANGGLGGFSGGVGIKEMLLKAEGYL